MNKYTVVSLNKKVEKLKTGKCCLPPNRWYLRKEQLKFKKKIKNKTVL
jgi:hypothetical protein